MRISGGSARGKQLAQLAGEEIRPTPVKVRQALFNILRSRFGSLQGLRVLDLFAGSGALTIEALSQGAREAILVDQGRQAASLITKNLAACRVADRARFLQADALEALKQLRGPFDLILLDPPYGQGLQERALKVIAQRQLLAPDGLLCAEAAREEALPEAVAPLQREGLRRYGSTALHFYSHKPSEADTP